MSAEDDIRESPVTVAIFPSRLMAALRMTNGRAAELTGISVPQDSVVIVQRPVEEHSSLTASSRRGSSTSETVQQTVECPFSLGDTE